MKISKYLSTLTVAMAALTLNAEAQSCQTISSQSGPTFLSLTPSHVSLTHTQCYIDPSALNGAAIACIHGLPSNTANQQILAKVALRTPLTAAEKTTLTGITSIRGGFTVDSLASSIFGARTAILANRQAFNSYINANYTPGNALPTLKIFDIDASDDSVSTTEIAGTSGIIDGYHASGNLSTLVSTLFHFISDAQNMSGTYFLRIGGDLSTWSVCQNMPALINALIYNVTREYQTAGAAKRTIMLR